MTFRRKWINVLSFFKFVNGYKSGLVLILILLSIGVPIFEVWILDVTRDVINQFNNSADRTELLGYIKVLLLLIIASAIANWCFAIVMGWNNSNNEEKSKILVMDHFVKHKLSDYDTAEFQQKSSLIRYGLSNCVENFFVIVNGAISSLIKVIALLATISLINNIMLTLVLVVFIIPISIIRGYINRTSLLLDWHNSYNAIKSGYYKGLLLNTSLAPEIMMNGSSRFMFNKWNQHMSIINERDYRTGIKRYKLSLLLGFLLAVIISIYITNVTLTEAITRNPGDLFLVVTGAILIILSSEQIFSQIQMIGFQCDQYMMYKDYIVNSSDNDNMQNSSIASKHVTEENSNDLQIKNLSYSYPKGNDMVLQDISLTFSEGEKIAVVGPNGAGKSTLYHCLMGLLEPVSGSVRIKGHIPHRLSPEERALLFSPVFQSTHLYKGITIMENVDLGRKVDLSTFNRFYTDSENNPNQLYGGHLGGVELSGGQIQKLGILKGILGNGILILDEPTAALDPIAEQEIVSKLLHHSKDRTVILTTHRMGITLQFDRIIVLNNGAVIQDGSPKELLEQDGLFKDMFESQGQIYRTLSEVD